MQGCLPHHFFSFKINWSILCHCNWGNIVQQNRFASDDVRWLRRWYTNITGHCALLVTLWLRSSDLNKTYLDYPFLVVYNTLYTKYLLVGFILSQGSRFQQQIALPGILYPESTSVPCDESHYIISFSCLFADMFLTCFKYFFSVIYWSFCLWCISFILPDQQSSARLRVKGL